MYHEESKSESLSPEAKLCIDRKFIEHHKYYEDELQSYRKRITFLEDEVRQKIYYD